MQASEPADVAKVKLLENLEATLWDRWEVKGKELRVKDVIKEIEEKYVGLEVRDVFRGNSAVYLKAMGKEKDLDKKVEEITEGDEKYVELTITCVKKGDDKIISGVPPVRVYFE